MSVKISYFIVKWIFYVARNIIYIRRNEISRCFFWILINEILNESQKRCLDYSLSLKIHLPITKTLKDLLAERPAASIAVYVTTVLPIGNVSPGLWFDVSVTGSPEMSLEEGGVHKTVAVAEPGSVCTVCGKGTFKMIGSSESEEKI